MVDRLLRVHIQSQQAFGPWWTLSYNNEPQRLCLAALLQLRTGFHLQFSCTSRASGAQRHLQVLERELS